MLFEIIKKLFKKDDVRAEEIRSYLDNYYVDARKAAEYGCSPDDEIFEIYDWQEEEEESCGGPVYDDAVYSSYDDSVYASYDDEDASEPTQELFAGKALADLLEEESLGFSQTLLDYIDQTGKKDSDIYKKANVDKKLFSKIRSNPNYKPSKTTALAFAVALELDLEETKDLIGRAGYALTRSSKADLIVAYYISRKVYNIHKINMTLFEFDQSLLGSK